jgi:hypothetical protein
VVEFNTLSILKECPDCTVNEEVAVSSHTATPLTPQFVDFQNTNIASLLLTVPGTTEPY